MSYYNFDESIGVARKVIYKPSVLKEQVPQKTRGKRGIPETGYFCTLAKSITVTTNQQNKSIRQIKN